MRLKPDKQKETSENQPRTDDFEEFASSLVICLLSGSYRQSYRQVQALMNDLLNVTGALASSDRTPKTGSRICLDLSVAH